MPSRDAGESEIVLVEYGIKVIVVTWQALVVSQEESRKRLGDREPILSIECFNNVD